MIFGLFSPLNADADFRDFVLESQRFTRWEGVRSSEMENEWKIALVYDRFTTRVLYHVQALLGSSIEMQLGIFDPFLIVMEKGE